jgi:two-component system, cell cycle response regulator
MKKTVLFIGFGEIQLELARRFLSYRGMTDLIDVRGEQGATGAVDGYVINTDDLPAVSRLALHVRSNPKPVLSLGAIAAPGSSVFVAGPFKPATADRLKDMMTGRSPALASRPGVAASPPTRAALGARPGAQPASAANKVLAFPRAAAAHDPNAMVLVVDDSDIVRRTMMRKINDYGHTTDLAANGEEAMAMMLNNKYRVIFLDVMMPGLDGLEICKRIKRSAEYKGTAVYMLTSKDGMFDRVRATMAGCDGYLVKPLESRKLRDVLEKYFDRPSIIGDSTIQVNHPLNAAELAFIEGTPPPGEATGVAPLTVMEPLLPEFTNSFAPTFAPTVPAGLLERKAAGL